MMLHTGLYHHGKQIVDGSAIVCVIEPDNDVTNTVTIEVGGLLVEIFDIQTVLVVFCDSDIPKICQSGLVHGADVHRFHTA